MLHILLGVMVSKQSLFYYQIPNKLLVCIILIILPNNIIIIMFHMSIIVNFTYKYILRLTRI